MTSRTTCFFVLIMALALSNMGCAAPVPDEGAAGEAIGSLGVLSGNLLQVPVYVPVNVCGNAINVIDAD